MRESTTPVRRRQSTPHATLVAVGLKVQQLDLFGPIRQQVHIRQKTVRYTPTDKLYDAWIAILAGAHGLVEVNTRLRSDPALQAAFGRSACAEQSVIQQTLDACDAIDRTADGTGAHDDLSPAQPAPTPRLHPAAPAPGHRYDRVALWPQGRLGDEGLLRQAAQSAWSPTRPRAGDALSGSRGRAALCRHGSVVQALATLGRGRRAGAGLGRRAPRPHADPSRRRRRERGRHQLAVGAGLCGAGQGVFGQAGAQAGRHSARRGWTTRAWPGGRSAGCPARRPSMCAAVRRVAVRCRKKNGQWGIGVLIAPADCAGSWI